MSSTPEGPSRHVISRRSLLGVAGGVALLGASDRLQRPAGARALSSAGRLLSSSPPPVTVTVPPGATAPGNILLTPTHSTAYGAGPMIVDSSGDVVWFHPVTDSATNLQMQWYRGEPVLTWWEGQVISPGFGRGRYHIVDSSYRKVAVVNGGQGLMGDLHEFVIAHQRTALFTAFKVRPADLSAVGGPADGQLLDAYFQEVDIATGAVLTTWRASDHVALDESYETPPASSNKPYDFFHINSLDVDTDGNFLVSGRHTWCIYKVNRSTGDVMWRLHGKKSDFKMKPGSRFSWQHHVRHHNKKVLTVFDNGAGRNVVDAKRSRGIMLAVDASSMTVELVHQYLPRPRLVASSQGSVQTLPNGNVFVGWGKQPYFSEYSAEGKLLYDAHLPPGINSYRAFRSPWPPG